MAVIRLSYTIAQKLIVVGIAESIGVVAAANKCNISHSMVSRWRKDKNKLMSVSRISRKIGSGRRPAFPTEEEG